MRLSIALFFQTLRQLSSCRERRRWRCFKLAVIKIFSTIALTWSSKYPFAQTMNPFQISFWVTHLNFHPYITYGLKFGQPPFVSFVPGFDASIILDLVNIGHIT